MFKPGDRVEFLENYHSAYKGEQGTVTRTQKLVNMEATQLVGVSLDNGAVVSGVFDFRIKAVKPVDVVSVLSDAVFAARDAGYKVEVTVTPPPVTPDPITL